MLYFVIVLYAALQLLRQLFSNFLWWKEIPVLPFCISRNPVYCVQLQSSPPFRHFNFVGVYYQSILLDIPPLALTHSQTWHEKLMVKALGLLQPHLYCPCCIIALSQSVTKECYQVGFLENPMRCLYLFHQKTYLATFLAFLPPQSCVRSKQTRNLSRNVDLYINRITKTKFLTTLLFNLLALHELLVSRTQKDCN